MIDKNISTNQLLHYLDEYIILDKWYKMKSKLNLYYKAKPIPIK